MAATDNLLIRADAGPMIGAGHVMRCVALAQQWQAEGGRTTFVCSELPGILSKRLRTAGCEVEFIDVAVGSQDDAAATLDLARDLNAVVVADGYHFSVDYQRAVNSEARLLLVLDDYGQIGTYRADMILDQNLGTTEDTYLNRSPGCQLLLGSEYVMLRREFLSALKHRHEVHQTVRNVLVTTGGADVGRLAGRILYVLDEIPASLTITVVAGGIGTGANELEERTKCSHHRVRLIENAANMPQLMIEADLAISAAGSTIWELAYLGVPAILGVVADNQRVGASALERCGAAMAFDGTSKSSVDELRQALGTVYDDQPRRAAMSEAARGLVDGNGVALVAKQILDTARRRCR